jgi:hypothetical protein
MKHHPVHKTPFATTQIGVEKQTSERETERETERWGNAHILRDFDSAFDELLPAAPQHLHTHRLLRNPHPEIFLKSLLLQTTTKLTNPVHE